MIISFLSERYSPVLPCKYTSHFIFGFFSILDLGQLPPAAFIILHRLPEYQIKDWGARQSGCMVEDGTPLRKRLCYLLLI